MPRVKFSDLQFGVIELFPPNGRLSESKFLSIDQRITSSLGPTKKRRRPPYVVKAPDGDYVLTQEGKDARNAMHHAEIMRSVARVDAPAAHCFDSPSANFKWAGPMSRRNIA